MREIKFRAWDKEKRKIWPVALITWDVGGLFITENERHTVYQDAVELMQFAGLKDKNGKEIYEGDIVDYADEKIVVKFGIQQVDAFEGMAWNLWSFYDDDGNGYKANGKRLQSSIEVIGNIYENPELIGTTPAEEGRPQVV